MLRSIVPVLALLAAGAAHAGTFATITGQRTGRIEGDASRGHEGQIQVLGWSHEVVSPRDAATGLPTGRRQHGPVTILKRVDKATPLIFQALVNNENLSEVVIQVTRRDDAGVERPYMTIRLTNASVISQARRGGELSGTEQKNLREEVSFTYQRIEISSDLDGIQAADDWAEPI